MSPEQRTHRGRADYGLRLGRGAAPSIFVETKRLELGPEGLDGSTTRGGKKVTFPQQAIEYSWQMGADWAVLTNFRETRLYFSHIDPRRTEDGLVWSFKWDEYLDRFDELWLISKESVASRAIYGHEKKRTRLTIHQEAPVELFSCRNILVSDIRRLNPKVTLPEIRSAVQRILDRLIVIRVAEDRGILPSEGLWTRYRTWVETRFGDATFFSEGLEQLFRRFDSVYNSEMFAAGHICEKVSVSDGAISQVLDVLYAFNFELLDADILGSIYEGYLGHVLTDDEGGVKFQQVNGVRKKTGVYYTPTYVVGYIVDQALGPMLKSADLRQVERLRILDPACGSGSFLIKAFDRVAEFYEHRRSELREAARLRKSLTDHPQHPEDTSGYRERILADNLFGVDLDPQAAEITAINLMLKALQKGQKLPSILKGSVQVGNSLVSGDEKSLRPYFGEKWLDAHPLNWSEAFATVMAEGGFDVVVGNPPYVNIVAIPEEERAFFFDQKGGRARPFPHAAKRTDLYVLFIELGLRLLKQGGRLSFIIPFPFLYSPYADSLRQYILETCCIEQIIDLSDVRVFADPSVYNVIIVLRKESDPKVRQEAEVGLGIVPAGTELARGVPKPTERIPQSRFAALPRSQLRLEVRDPAVYEVAKKIGAAGVRLGEVFYINWGLRTGTKEKTERLITSDGTLPNAKPMVRGEDIVDKYLLDRSGQFIIYDTAQLYNSLFPECIVNPKIIIRKISGDRGLFATFDSNGLYPFSTVIIALPYAAVEGVKRADVPAGAAEQSRGYDPKYVLAVMNSKVERFYYDVMIGDHLSVVPNHIKDLRIPNAPPEVQRDLAQKVGEVMQLRSELREEQRLVQYQRVASAKTQVGTVDLRKYLDTLDERNLVKGNLESEFFASRIEVTPRMESEWLILSISYQTKRERGKVKKGEVRCRLPEPQGPFLFAALSGGSTFKVPAGKLMSRIGTIQTPLFAEEWQEHLTIVRDIMDRIGAHQSKATELAARVAALDAEIDNVVAGLFGLRARDIQTIDGFKLNPRPIKVDDGE